jgi:hypothetical protein
VDFVRLLTSRTCGATFRASMRTVLAGLFCAIFWSVVGAQAPAPPAPQPGARGRGAAPGLEPRIVSFEARPATVRAGEPVILVWQTENPAGGVSIDPNVGAVAARGSRTVRPSATTTFTLSMRGGPSRAVTVTVQSAPTRGTATFPSETSTIPRLPDGRPAIRLTLEGRPDLTGVYGNAGLPAGTMPPPLKAGAEKFRIVRGANDIRGRTTLTTGNDCKPLGIPQTYITPYPFQIVQTPKLVLIVYEYPNAIRWIPVDGRAHEVDPDPTWMGSSVGRWEGDTLVVDAIGFNDKTEVHGFLHTDALHVVERFKLLPDGNLQYDVTVEDPNVWQTPWVIPARTFPRRPELENVAEFVCESTVNYQRLFQQ